MAFDANSEISGEFGETIGPPSISKRVSISNERVSILFSLYWTASIFRVVNWKNKKKEVIKN